MESHGEGDIAEGPTPRGRSTSAQRPSLRRVTTATAIYDELYEAIVNMRLVPGTPLQEKR